MQHIDCYALKSTMHAASIYSSELQHSAECRAVGWMRTAEGNPLFLNLAPIGQYCSSGSHNQWAHLRHSSACLPCFPVPTKRLPFPPLLPCDWTVPTTLRVFWRAAHGSLQWSSLSSVTYFCVGILTLSSGHCYKNMTQNRHSFVSQLRLAATILILWKEWSLTSLNSQEECMAIWICCLLPVMWWLCGWPWRSLKGHKRVGKGEADTLKVSMCLCRLVVELTGCKNSAFDKLNVLQFLEK